MLETPTVFLANVVGPWLHPETERAETIIAVAHRCPSGAITYRRKDGGPDEAAPPVNVLRVRENGPLALSADLLLDLPDAVPDAAAAAATHDAPSAPRSIGFRATLCRCGQSQNKPFCDGAHNAARFVASGEPATQPSEPLARRDGPLVVRPTRNGPLHVRGNLELCTGTGRTVTRTTEAWLCRCGGSANKPFCDGTHAKNGFQAAGSD
ncbi:MAG: CDGSH iron-sulfur domain-containing protein [Myxococcota bacterium]